ncbi:MAG: TrkH family potassium uptake protein [Bacteroidetes bacterium]|nr:TrkH family potassium uptake protein [Bacteroidota bacterium]MBU1677746.1 TrkH family potassium uptake protein [Bacteroidota bacterium]MBU2506087.1 TrkH family potassium uptake protein [Bacteroidota bacterium]
MRPYIIIRYLGFILLLNALFLLISAGIALFNNDSSFFPLLYTGIVALLFGIYPLMIIPTYEDITYSEGNTIVISGWLISCVIGAIPYIIWGGEFSITNAWFESVSGYTTTGASILTNVEALPKGLLFWRASTHWIGGIGIIVFVLALLPSSNYSTLVLYRSEVSSVAMRQFKMRSKDALNIIIYVYVGLTAAQTILLYLFGMNLLDSVSHSFATIATGGFSTRNLSIAYYNDIWIESTIMIFMLLSGMNFALLFAVVIGKFSSVKKSTVLKYYLLANLAGILITALNVHGANYESFWDSLRYSSFQILSVGTSTGFANADSSVWPAFSQLVIIFFTLQCACAGSTSGGIKTDRIIIFYKTLMRNIKRTIHPNAVFNIYIDKQNVDETKVSVNNIFIITYLIIVLISTALLTLLNIDLLTSFSGTIAAMGNVGPGLGNVGSLENYSGLHYLGKWILSIVMILGRLEIFGIVILFFPKAWK